MSLTKSQSQIIDKIRSNNGSIKKAEAVEMLKHNYYSNAGKYVGDILSRMVVSGLLVRVKNGVFKEADKSKENEKQLNIFEL